VTDTCKRGNERRWLPPGLLRLVVGSEFTDVSEVLAASVIRAGWLLGVINEAVARRVLNPESRLLHTVWLRRKTFVCQVVLNSVASRVASVAEVTNVITNQLTPRCQNPRVHHHIHNSPPMISILSQVNLLHSSSQPTSLTSILIPSSHLRLGLTSGLFLRAFPPEPCTRFSPLPCVPHASPTSFSLIWSA
jgi:hypothetical protein